ncbi:hypothetical protein AGMMS50212_08500 [Spirochaetia bacterium]|nr:hypothetical protein AGMMS50212_08500 [Spirochaetia bacterium]
MDKPEILFANRYIESYVDPLIPVVYKTKTVQTAKKPYSNAYGNMVSEFRPIMKGGAVATVLELDYDISFLDQVRRQARIALLVSLILAILLAGILAIVLSGSLTRPIGKLAAYARRIGEGDLDSKITIKGKDEIAELGTILSKMTTDIKEYINNLNRVTAEKERINSELNVASDIQNDMLPHISPTFSNNKRFSIFAKMEPAKEVGGDFYDFFYIDTAETKIVLVIADVSGKSVSAALFMVIAKTLIKQQMLHYGDPAAVLDHVNKVLCEDNPRCMFVTVFICSIDLTTGQMIYANGGHNPPLLARGEPRTIGSAETAESNQPYQFIPLKKGIPLGMMETSQYKTSFLQLNYGDKLYLYTDGINEAMNIHDNQFGNDRFLETANKFRDLPPKEFDEAIRREVEGFVADAEQSDDITTLSMRYTGCQTV